MERYIIFSFIATICFALSQLLSKFASKHTIDNKNSMMAYFMFFCFIYAGLLFVLIGSVSFPPQALFPFLVVVATFATGYYSFYTAVFDTDASSFAPLFQLQAVFIAIFAFFFLGERFPLTNYLWMTLVVLGAILVSLDEKMHVKSFLKKGFLIIIVMQVFHAISNLFVGITLKYVSPLEILFWQYAVLGLISVPFVLLAKPKLNYSIKSLIPLALATWISSTGAVFLFRAFQTNLTIPSTIALLTSPVILISTFIASIVKPDLLEYHTKRVYLIRGLGVVLILLGVLNIIS